MAAILKDGGLMLTGYVGELYFEDGFTSGDVVLALAQVADDSEMTVYINSPGGIATEGAAIHAVLSRRTGTTNVVIDGVSASAASLIAMAGDTVTMSAGATMMIHDPAGYTQGNSAVHAKQIEALEALATAYAGVYAAKSGKSVEECREMMKAETWFTPEQAVEAGFADATAEMKSQPVAAWDYRIYAHAPRELVALTKRKNWSLSEADKKAVLSASATRPTEEQSMTDKERADQLAAENTQLKTDLEAANAAKDTGVTEAGENAAAIVELCAKAGVPTMAATLIRERLTIEQATARADTAKDIRAAVDTARKSYPKIEANLGETFIASGLSMDQVRSKLFEQMTAAQSPEITSAHQATDKPDEVKATADAIVASIRPNRTKRSA